MYANVFYDYRCKSVWSAPECLAQKKRMLEPTVAMDAYSFGVICWEIWHEKVPFEGELSEALEVVVKEDLRPRIDEACVSEAMAELIRTCW